MGKRKTKASKQPVQATNSMDKGRIVEQVVAMMHATGEVRVERNVRLPALDGSGRRREIDVLVTGNVAGWPLQIAIECKNEAKMTGAPLIDAFVGKLQDVGLPVRTALFVSARAYTRGAIARAKAAGIRPLQLHGLTKDKLASEVNDAYQRVVFLLLVVDNLRINCVEALPEPQGDEAAMFVDDTGEYLARVDDLVWQAWHNGQPDGTLGEHHLDLTVPPGWCYRVCDRNIPARSVEVMVQVIGFILKVRGDVTQHGLVDQASKEVAKLHIQAKFAPITGKQTVFVVTTEDELEAAMQPEGDATISVGRVRLPRIRAVEMYWPPSERVMSILVPYMDAVLNGTIQEMPEFNFEQLEGTDLGSIYDPIWSGYHTPGAPTDRSSTVPHPGNFP